VQIDDTPMVGLKSICIFCKR